MPHRITAAALAALLPALASAELASADAEARAGEARARAAGHLHLTTEGASP